MGSKRMSKYKVYQVTKTFYITEENEEAATAFLDNAVDAFMGGMDQFIDSDSGDYVDEIKPEDWTDMGLDADHIGAVIANMEK
jgi:hypothetical protein